MSSYQKPSGIRTPTKTDIPRPAGRAIYTKSNSLFSDASIQTNSPKLSDNGKLPFLKRSGTYIVESPSNHVKSVNDSNESGIKATTASRPSIPKPQTKSNNTGKTIPPVLSKQSSLPSSSSKTAEDSNESTSPGSKSVKPSLAMIKQQKRAEMLKLNSKKPIDASLDSDGANLNTGNSRSIDFIIKNARKTGVLNLSDYSLTEVPRNVWNINIEKEELSFEEKSPVSMENDGFKWWEQVNLTKLILASNKIKIIPKDVQQLATALTYLDIHDNQLESIDEEIGELNLLQTLNISHNQLTTLPNNICQLVHIVNFNASHNKLNQLPKNFGHLDDLEDLNLSNNCFSSLPKSFGWLTKLRKINLANNKLVNLIPELFYSSNLKIIDLSENEIEEIPAEISELSSLEQFFARQNKIKKFPTFKKCCKLKDLDMSFNQLTEIDEKIFDNLVSIVNLNIRDNKLTNLPKAVQVLQNIERFDLSNNDLSGLPPELATIESLKQILLVGNPLRSIRRDIINRGTDAIIKYLRNHLEIPPDSPNDKNNSEEMILKSEVIKSTKVFDLSCKKLTSITPNMITVCKQSTALVLNASKTALTDLPAELEILGNQINELNLSFNAFTSLPRALFTLSNLVNLDIRANKLATIPNEINRLTALREIIIADNKLTEIPQGIYELPILENLFANNNQIKTIDPNRIINMKFLSTLNLQNNDITNVPPELGKAEQIKCLQLEGNPFKIPRTQILAKGTLAIMEYLRGRLTES